MPSASVKRLDAAHARLLQLVTEECVPGDRLASEAELSRWLGVSRPSLREVLSDLAATGLIERRWGVGTFVRHPYHAAIAHLEELAPLMQIIRRLGHSAGVRMLGAVRLEGPSDSHQALHLHDSAFVWQVTRLYHVDAAPALYVQDYLPESLNGRPFDPTLLDNDLMPLLETEYGIPVDRAMTLMDPESPTQEVASALCLAPGDLVLAIRQTAYASGTNTPVIYTYGLSNPAVFKYSIIRRRHAQWRSSVRRRSAAYPQKQEESHD